MGGGGGGDPGFSDQSNQIFLTFSITESGV